MIPYILNSTIVISFVGYKTQEIPVAGKTQINVTMKEDTEMLDEVVVVGYGRHFGEYCQRAGGQR